MLFDHTYIDHGAKKTLVTLHGTGGTKSDFLFLDEQLHGNFNILALQGNILEHGMPRFFRRLSPGVFDQENIQEELQKLQEFLTTWRQSHHQTPDDFVYLGYSNGANFILAVLFTSPELISAAALLHPMIPFVPGDLSLSNNRLFVSGGEHDPMVSTAEQKALIQVLREKGAQLTTHLYSGGHEVSPPEILDAVAFLLKNI